MIPRVKNLRRAKERRAQAENLVQTVQKLIATLPTGELQDIFTALTKAVEAEVSGTNPGELASELADALRTDNASSVVGLWRLIRWRAVQVEWHQQDTRG